MVRKVHARQAGKPILIIATADASKESLRSQVTAAGAGDFLIKPVDAERLSQCFGAFLASRGATPSSSQQLRKKV
jgi:response regulator of citrate/malate metabolism